MNHLPLIIKREYLNKVRNKAFIIMTFLSPLLMIGIFSLVAYLSQLNNDKVRTISVLDESGWFANQFENKDNFKFNILKDIDLESAQKATQDSEVYGLLYIPKTASIDELSKKITFYSEDTPSLIVMDNIEDVIQSKANALKLTEAGLDAEQIKNLRVKIDTQLKTFGGEETSKLGSGLKLIFGGLAGYLLFMFIIIYGNMIMRSVIEEKTSRIIEVIISSVKPIKLLLGKIVGTSLAGVTQFVAWVVLLGVMSIVVPSILGIDVSSVQSQQQEALVQLQNNPGGMEGVVADVMKELPNLPVANLIVMFILFFIGGYLLYASMYAAIGAAVDSETDTQQFMLPMLLPLILAVYVGFFTVIEDPHGTVSQVFSYIPFTSPVVMLMRIPFGVPLWQQIISVVILFATFMGTVWFAAKIYRVGILMYGKKPSYKELIKWLKY
ncbi:MAG TPA: ABC transporter permease [Flavobacteriaceae bacterium]|nr:ABC transporter permease [Flavobacteriaceae bacterium]MCB9213666.1 ABC transporter permease [Alteromonas sp.]HPF12167.1 ABC transporter permease [Flavobacteriaceae bacterium]HQU22300.1 ABC transporter permease [Flavobacteriaceae bacterium]HQU65996.1 ABC transporter permease [Flavobacteriaceae bacterium]